MRRKLLALLATVGLIFSGLGMAVPTATAAGPFECIGAPANEPQGGMYPEPRVFLESQAWWNKAGIQIPAAVGHHIHLGTCTPIDGQVINGTLRFELRITLHDQVGSVTDLRYSDWTTDIGRRNVNFPGCHDCTYWASYDINFSTWSTGRHEIHWRANVEDEQPDGLPGSDSGEQRMFQSTGWQYCVRSCTPNAGGNNRAVPWTEARGWYQNQEYQNARFRSFVPNAPISGNWTFNYEMKPGSGGRPTREWGLYIDPDFHNGNQGTRIAHDTSASGSRSATINTNTLSNGLHRLVMVTSDGNNAGVLMIPFIVANGAGPTPTPTAAPTPSPTPTASPTPTPTPVITPSPTPTLTPTPTPIPSVSLGAGQDLRVNCSGVTTVENTSTGVIVHCD